MTTPGTKRQSILEALMNMRNWQTARRARKLGAPVKTTRTNTDTEQPAAVVDSPATFTRPPRSVWLPRIQAVRKQRRKHARAAALRWLFTASLLAGAFVLLI